MRACVNIATVDGPEDDRYAMFDVAYYLNTTREGVPTLCNVSAHFDPGLLGINWLSTAPGLQMLPANGPWIDVPLTNGVLWAGGAAQASYCKAGVHRVLYGDVPRLAVWSEAVVAGQLLTKGDSVANTDNVLPKLDADLWAIANPLSQEEMQQGLAIRIERMYGIPISKTMIHTHGQVRTLQPRGPHGSGHPQLLQALHVAQVRLL